MPSTIQESAAELHIALSEYIEATYHIGDAALVKARKRLLDEPGNVHQIPFLESTPRYESDQRFANIEELPRAVTTLLETLSTKANGHKPLLHNPPYAHQAEAIQQSIVNGKNLLIMTGTGSGKTESFLMPILAKIAIEASGNPDSFANRAVRALLLYPMNALVNDQLGRLRSMFSDPRVTETFESWAGRMPQFARYTSRTPYAGVRDRKKDDNRLKSLDEFYVAIERQALGDDPLSERAESLRQQLKAKGKWPAKPSLSKWLGKPGSPWQKRGTSEFIRAVTLPEDSELITRHEVQCSPPDLLVTNYSMLEYMLMRPIERSIFDDTRAWLESDPQQKFMVILDEAHLYRGAGGAEVGLLIRRLADRLGVTADRIQAICATASFSDPAYAKEFGAQLSGCAPETFVSVVGRLKKKADGTGTHADAVALADVDVDVLEQADTTDAQAAIVESFLNYRGVAPSGSVEQDLFAALDAFGPLQFVVNETMGTAQPLGSLPDRVFPGVDKDLAGLAFSNLLALGTRARSADDAGLLPCRVHTFFRGLPGLWVCMDPGCTETTLEEKNPYCGKLYSQPIKQCGCGATCLEFYTCRHCGAPYARAYTDNVEEPNSLWSEPGANIELADGEAGQLEALDLLLQAPVDEAAVVAADYDVETGRLNAYDSGARSRQVYCRPLDAKDLADDDDGERSGSPGQFIPCGICGKKAGGGKSSVQDHMTKGDYPFQALVARQIQIQPPGPRTDDNFAPLRGRKVLAFSDSRQVAARLAPNLQTYSMRDALRPLLIWGMKHLQQSPSLGRRISLQDAYFATLLAARSLSVRLRPELKSGESFDPYARMGVAIAGGGPPDDDVLYDLHEEYRDRKAPFSLLDELLNVIEDPYIGLEAIALGSLTVRPRKQDELLRRLPDLPGIATNERAKLSLVGFWLRCWRKKHIWFEGMDDDLWQRQVHGHTGNFKIMGKILPDKTTKDIFAKQWVPALLEEFTEKVGSTQRLHAQRLYLQLGGQWVRCPNCASVHRPIENHASCVDCGKATVLDIDPDQDEVFRARKGYYRRATQDVLRDEPLAPLALIAAEHTAQLNSSDQEDAFSKAERNELLFQDINISWQDQSDSSVAIDILSSTTTMEVGIDIGALSGVALRNMPPGRANYQQRAGRAGRRGSAVATVVAFGSVDSHDEHYFSNAKEMISGDVVDPILTLGNMDIARRHVRAFLLQCYHQDRLPEFDPQQPNDLFSVLGKVGAFREGTGLLNRDDFQAWLQEHEAGLKVRVARWLPEQLTAAGIEELAANMAADCLEAIDAAIAKEGKQEPATAATASGLDWLEQDPDVEEEKPPRADADKLLDRLLYEGVLPRYAFPTDVATFHIFDREKSTDFRHKDAYSPSQGLPVALSQYAPGKQVWVGGKCYMSGAIYSRSGPERIAAWDNRELYYECSICRFAETREGDDNTGSSGMCPACGSNGTFELKGPWMRPVGFAHPVDMREETSPDRVPDVSYATRAKLTTKTPGSERKWADANPRFAGLPDRTHLLVSNVGPKGLGYRYCVSCGRIEAMTEPVSAITGAHRVPYPTKPGQESCRGRRTELDVVLGARFVTDIALFSLRVDAPMSLQPGTYASNVALRTVSEALARAATDILGIEPGEILAEYRPAMSADARSDLCAEIFLYDTLPGGAGFSSAMPNRAADLLTHAHKLLVSCPAQCDSSCYRCLRAFGNRIEHRSLDRHVGAELIDYLISGVVPETESDRIERSTDLLFRDLSRFLGEASDLQCRRSERFEIEGAALTAPILCRIASSGRNVVVALCSALKEGHPADSDVRRLQEIGAANDVVIVNELLVRSNLPAATRWVRERIGR